MSSKRSLLQIFLPLTHISFGFQDGISNPFLDEVDTVAIRGSETINQGIILAGRKGDVPVDGTGKPLVNFSRPAWALDGSFLAFRYLRQLVPEFDAFLEKNALPVPPPVNPGDPVPTGAEKLGARLVGRWKSGMYFSLYISLCYILELPHQ